ncbi:MAG TPA: four helix bundle protein [Vicinamibacterales bacterium]|jgi:four helix bundle protein|nr:four helix bundle protein [Vicinamibacterales bacterium]
MKGARSHEELIVWRLSYELKLAVYELIKTTPIRGDRNLHDQLRNAASAAPRLVAEGFGRYLPGEFSRYLRNANGELKETFDALRDAVDRGYVKQDQIVPLQRLSKRASKAASGLIKYLRTATPPNEAPRRQRRRGEPAEPTEPAEPSEPSEPDP